MRLLHLRLPSSAGRDQFSQGRGHVGFVDLPISAASNYDNVTTAIGTRGAPRWGDFMGIRNHAEREARFISTGFTLEADPDDESATLEFPRYTIFSRRQG